MKVQTPLQNRKNVHSVAQSKSMVCSPQRSKSSSLVCLKILEEHLFSEKQQQISVSLLTSSGILYTDIHFELHIKNINYIKYIIFQADILRFALNSL